MKMLNFVDIFNGICKTETPLIYVVVMLQLFRFSQETAVTLN